MYTRDGSPGLSHAADVFRGGGQIFGCVKRTVHCFPILITNTVCSDFSLFLHLVVSVYSQIN